jgi:hypothetical protein
MKFIGIKITYLFFIVGLTTNVLSAQDGTYYTVSDLEVWSGATLKYKFNSDWSASFENEFRLKSDASVMDQNFTQLSVKRKIGDSFSAGIAYRYILNNDNKGDVQGIEHYYRWNADLGYKLDVNRFTFSSRLRYQSKKEFGVDGRDNTFRFKIGSEYNIKKWKFDPVFSAEVFNGLSDSEGFNKYRFTIGTEYKFKNAGKISGFYRIEQGLIGLYPATNYIIGLRYQYTIKNY